MTHLCVQYSWKAAFVTWAILMSHTTCSVCAMIIVCVVLLGRIYFCQPWPPHESTHPYVWYESDVSFVCIRVCAVTHLSVLHSCVCHDSFVCFWVGRMFDMTLLYVLDTTHLNTSVVLLLCCWILMIACLWARVCVTVWESLAHTHNKNHAKWQNQTISACVHMRMRTRAGEREEKGKIREQVRQWE